MPKWAKQASAFAGGVTAIIVAVTTILPLLKSAPPTRLAVFLGQPEWAEQEVTLGSYLAWQKREDSILGLRALGEHATAQLELVTVADTSSIAPEPTGSSSAQTTSTGVTSSTDAPPQESVGTSGSQTSSSPSSTPSASSTQLEEAPPPKRTRAKKVVDRSTDLRNRAQRDTKGKPLSSSVLHETTGSLTDQQTSKLLKKATRQEAALKSSQSQQQSQPSSACQGIGYGGCSPSEAVKPESGVMGTSTATATTTTPAPAPPTTTSREGSAVGAAPPEEGMTGTSPDGETEGVHTRALNQSQTELLELASGSRAGREEDADLIPSPVTAGLSSGQRNQVAAMLGDAVSFEVHTEGWIGQRLWLTWTMYERNHGHWNPSSHVYLIDHAEAYVVPQASNDEGILTFWFPIPKQHGTYQVRYLIRSPGDGRPLKSGKTLPFRS